MSACCMAMTGSADCVYDDEAGAHSCLMDPGHINPPHFNHECECGYRWVCLSGSIDDYDIRFKVREGQS